MSDELVELRKPYSATFDLGNGKRQFISVLGTRLHNDDGSESDFELRRVNNAQLDGWHVLGNDVHYALGKPGDKPTDGWFGYGGRAGEHWLNWRLLRLGYLHWPSRAWQDIGGAPTYNRGKLSRDISSVTLGPSGAERTINVATSATWQDIWSVAGKGIDLRWGMEGRSLKEEIVVPQEARQWITANRPPTTPASETWFGFVFRIDPSDIPKWRQAGQELDIDGDNNDDAGPIEALNAAGDVLAVMPVSQAFSDFYGSPYPEREALILRKRLWKDGDNYYLLVGARVDRLNALHEGAITFDPSYETQPDAAAGKDAKLGLSASDRNFGTTGEGGIGRFESDGNVQRALIEFDISSVSGTVTSATMTLYISNTTYSYADTLTDVYEIAAANADWPEGTKDNVAGGSADCCWDKKDQGTPGENWAGSAGLSTAGTDYVDAIIGTFTVPNPVVLDAAVTASLNAGVVDGWRTSDPGMLHRARTESGSNQGFHTYYSDDATAGTRPKLIVEYTAAVVLRRRRM